MEHADDVLRRLAVDREPRVRRVEHLAQAFLRRHVGGDDDHLRPRDHHVGGLLVGEVEDLVEHLLLLLLELALDGRALEQELQLGLRVDRAVGARRLQPEQAQRQLARALQEPDQRLEHEEEQPHRRRDEQRRPLRWPSEMPFGTSSPTTTWKNVSTSSESTTASTVAMIGSNSSVERVLAESADRQRGDGDAELHRGDEPRRHGGQAEHLLRPAVALLGHLLQTRAADGDERVLGRDEEAVQQHERRDGDQLEEEGHAPPTGA